MRRLALEGCVAQGPVQAGCSLSKASRRVTQVVGGTAPRVVAGPLDQAFAQRVLLDITQQCNWKKAGASIKCGAEASFPERAAAPMSAVEVAAT